MWWFGFKIIKLGIRTSCLKREDEIAWKGY